MRLAMNEAGKFADPTTTSVSLSEWQHALNDLMDIEKHYQRKEHLLFSCLERHGIAGPSKVMWGKDDEIRGLLKISLALYARRDMAVIGKWRQPRQVRQQQAPSKR